MDGVRYDYPNLLSGGGLNLISEKGLVASSLVPIYQSSTFPTHVTMATGVTPDKHGILHNGFFDRNRGFYSYSPDASWIESEPIWSLLELSLKTISSPPKLSGTSMPAFCLKKKKVIGTAP